jgi:integrase
MWLNGLSAAKCNNNPIRPALVTILAQRWTAMATIRKRGDRWQAQVRRTGTAALSRTFKLKADAERWAAGVEVDGERQGIASNPRHLKQTILGELIKRYRDTVVPLHRSRVNETAVLNAFLRQPIAGLSLSEVSASHFAVYRDQRLKQVKAGTVIRELGLIQHALEVGRKEWGISLPVNPVKAISKPKSDRPRDRRLQDGEWVAIQKALDTCRNPAIASVVKFAVATAMRRGEILMARWGDLNWSESTLHIPLTKNGHARTIPLSPGALRVLEVTAGLRDSDDAIFPVSCEAVKRAWQRLTRRAGIKNLHFHDLRHEAVSRFFELGLSIPEVALISGHKDPRMLFRYTHLRASDLAGKLQAFSSH